MSTVPAEARRLTAAEQIQVRLLRRLQREWTAGSKLPSIRDLSEELGSGYVNTHKAVQDLVAGGLLRSKRRVGVFVSEQLDQRQVEAHLQQLREPTRARPARHLVGVEVRLVLPSFTQDEFVVRMINHFTVEMQAMGASVTRLYDAAGDSLDLAALDAQALALFQPIARQVTLSDDQALVAVGTFVGSRFHRPTHVDVVTVDQVQGGEIAGKYLRERGFTSACFIGARPSSTGARLSPSHEQDEYDPVASQRLLGFERGWGATLPPQCRLVAENYMPEDAAAMLPQYLRLKPRPPVVFAATDDLALGVYYGAIAHGLVPGRDIHIMGFDGQAAGTQIVLSPLCTVEVPAERMGREAAVLLGERLRYPDVPAHRVRLGCTVREGPTVGEAGKRASSAPGRARRG